jgi:hypothetical protein
MTARAFFVRAWFCIRMAMMFYGVFDPFFISYLMHIYVEIT